MSSNEETVVVAPVEAVSPNVTLHRMHEALDELDHILNGNELVMHRELDQLRRAVGELQKHEKLADADAKEAARVEDRLDAMAARIGPDDSEPVGSPHDASNPKKKVAGWVPFGIPMRRRVQTLCVSLMLFFTGPQLAMVFTIILMLSWITLPLVLGYIAFIYLVPINHPEDPWKAWIKGPYLRHFRDYFPCRLIVAPETRELFDSDKNYMFIYHPHGLHCFGAAINFPAHVTGVHEKLKGLIIHTQTLASNFKIPFWREIIRWGGSGDSSAKTIRKTLAAGPGRSILLVVGGAEEALRSTPTKPILNLKKRKGFVKIALTTGSPLVPVYTFGETLVYGNLADGRPWLMKRLRSIQKVLGFAIPPVSGRGMFHYGYGILPHRQPVVSVVGKPLAVPKIAEPSAADIEEWHGKYMAAIAALHEEYRGVYGVDEGGQLVIE